MFFLSLIFLKFAIVSLGVRFSFSSLFVLYQSFLSEIVFNLGKYSSIIHQIYSSYYIYLPSLGTPIIWMLTLYYHPLGFLTFLVDFLFLYPFPLPSGRLPPSDLPIHYFVLQLYPSHYLIYYVHLNYYVFLV